MEPFNAIVDYLERGATIIYRVGATARDATRVSPMIPP